MSRQWVIGGRSGSFQNVFTTSIWIRDFNWGYKILDEGKITYTYKLKCVFGAHINFVHLL
jgi:hypothetical protein